MTQVSPLRGSIVDSLFIQHSRAGLTQRNAPPALQRPRTREPESKSEFPKFQFEIPAPNHPYPTNRLGSLATWSDPNGH